MVMAPLCDGCEHTPHNRDGVTIMYFFLPRKHLRKIIWTWEEFWVSG